MRGQVRIVAAIERRQVDDQRGDALLTIQRIASAIEVRRPGPGHSCAPACRACSAACAPRARGSEAARAAATACGKRGARDHGRRLRLKSSKRGAEMLAAEVANAQALRRHVADALRVGAVAMGRQRMGRAIAAAAAPYVADERACSDGRCAARRRRRRTSVAEHRSASGIEMSRPCAPTRQRRPAMSTVSTGVEARHERLVAQRLCATVPHAWQVRFCSEP